MEYPKSELFETLAVIEHHRWSDWQRYMHSKCKQTMIKDGKTGFWKDGIGLIIPPELVERWERQINTEYAALSEEEKNSDREQVMRYWDLIKK